MIDIIMSFVFLCFGGVLRYVYIYSSSVAVTVPERTDGALLLPRMGIPEVKTPKSIPGYRRTWYHMVYACGILGGWAIWLPDGYLQNAFVCVTGLLHIFVTSFPGGLHAALT